MRFDEASALVRLGVAGCAIAVAAAAIPAGAADLPRVVRGESRDVAVPRPPLADTDPASPYPVMEDGRVGIMVELVDEPSVLAWARERERHGARAMGDAEAQAVRVARDQRARIEQAQRSLGAILEAADLGGTVLFRVQRVYNGIAASVPAASVELVRGLPGVKAVRPLSRLVPDNFSSVPLIGAPGMWQDVGVRGEGVRVGIIDTGIDYLHADFGGSGNYGGQSFADSTVPWTAKVVGGYDFAGDAFTGGNAPVPDGDPMDCNGHGSHVAGTAAGYGVDGAGTPFGGPWGTGTPFASLAIGPGVAPQAQLFALKVFGCSGSTYLAERAIEWAVDPDDDGDFSDHLDVINLSLGAPYGGLSDSSAAAADAAALAGVLVACSAGNSGDSHFIIGGPGAADRAVSTASSVDAASVHGGFTVTAPAAIAGNYPMEVAGFGPDLTGGDVAGQLAYPSSNRDACAAFTGAAAAQVAGKVALVDRGSCSFERKVKACQDAGSVAVIVADNTTADLFEMADDTSFAATITIPAVLTSNAAGSILKGAPAGTVSVLLTRSLDGRVAYVNAAWEDLVSDFSSRGPRLEGGLKPDLAAPGDGILSALTQTGSRGASFSGTSMASPHVAGVLALLRQLHPGWTVEEIKALVMNTAVDLYAGESRTLPAYGPARVGAGRAALGAAADARVVAYDAEYDGRVGVSFGAPQLVGSYAARRQVAVVNKGATPATFDLAYESRSDIPGAAFSFPAGTMVTVPAGGSVSFPVELAVDPSQFKHTRDATEAPSQWDLPRHWLSEEAGYVTLTPSGGHSLATAGSLRLPVYAAPRPAAAMTSKAGQVVVAGATTSDALLLTGHGVDTGGSFPTDVVSLVGAFELQRSDEDDASLSGEYDMFDLAQVGAASDYDYRVAQGQGLAETTVAFGVAMFGDWSSPNQVLVRVDLDTNLNGSADFYLYGTSYGDALGADPSDSFISLLCPVGNGDCYLMPAWGPSPAQADVAPFGTNVLILPVQAARLGLISGMARFNYRVRSFAGAEVDNTPFLSFDPERPGLQFYAGEALPSLFVDLEGHAIPFVYDQADFAANASLGALLLHLHNGPGRRAEALPLASGGCTPACTATVPTVADAGSPVTFAATASGCGGPATYEWDFGDGTPISAGQSVSHAYAATGGYAWRLTVRVGSWSCRETGVIQVGGSVTPAYRYVVGAVAHNAGQGGSTWRTGAGVVNRAGGAAAVEVSYLSTGSPQVRTLSLADGVAVEWLDILEQLFGMAPGAESQGTVVFASDRPLVVTARTYNQSAAGTFGQYIPALTESDTVTVGEVGVLPHLKRNASFRTNLGLVNLSAASCSAAVKLFAAGGAQIGSTRNFEIGGERWFQQTDIFAGVGAAGSHDIAYATVEALTAGCRVWAYGSVVDGGTNDPTTIPLLVDPTTFAGLAATAAPRIPDALARALGARSVTVLDQPSRRAGPAAGSRRAATTTVLLQDDFEGPFPASWYLVEFTDTGWGLSTVRSSGAGHSVWCAGGGSSPATPGTGYPGDIEAWMLAGPFDLSDAESASLTFDAWFKTQSNKDYFWAMVSVDAENWMGYKFSGDSSSDTNFGTGNGGWGSVTLDFAELTEYIDPFAPAVYVAFLFTSDNLVELEGAYVDNVVLAKTGAEQSCSIACSATVPTSASAGEAVPFQAQATLTACGGDATIDWDFGDSTPHAGGQSTSHAYASPGSYDWFLTVTADGATCTRSGTVVVGAAGEAHAYLVGGVAHNGGQGGSQWRTDVACVNRSASLAHLALVYYAAGGTTTTRTTTLAAGATVEWRNILENLFSFSPTSESQGTVHVTADVPLLITARTYNQSTTGTFGQYLPALESGEFATAAAGPAGGAPAIHVGYGQPAVIPQLKNNAAFRCNVGAVNLSAQSCGVRVTLRDAAGGMLGAPVELGPAAGRWMQRSNIFGAAGVSGAVDVAYAVVEVTTPGCTAWVYASVVDNGTSDPTTIPAIRH